MRVVSIDLGESCLSWRSVRKEIIASYLGGRGLGVRYIYERLFPGIDPVGPENILTIWTSPLIGTDAFSMVKTCCVTKSPLSGTILMSLLGGHFGPHMRYAGADGLILSGIAKEPIYLLLKDGDVEIRNASHLWGKTTSETEKALREELRLPNMQVVCIGPAGEKFVSFAPDVPQTIRDVLFDPQTSGGLLIAVAAEEASELKGTLVSAGIAAAEIIGEVIAEPKEKIIVD